jgi:hypothetical protein
MGLGFPHWLALLSLIGGGLWLLRNPVVLNKLGVIGMFPMNPDLNGNFAAS